MPRYMIISLCVHIVHWTTFILLAKSHLEITWLAVPLTYLKQALDLLEFIPDFWIELQIVPSYFLYFACLWCFDKHYLSKKKRQYNEHHLIRLWKAICIHAIFVFPGFIAFLATCWKQ